MSSCRNILRAVTFLTLACLSCSLNPTNSTMGSETTNGVYVSVVSSSSIEVKTSPQASLYIYWTVKTPADTGYADSAHADNSGFYNFSDIPSGKYNLFVFPRNDTLAALVQNISVGSNAIFNDSAFFKDKTGISGTVSRNGTPVSGVNVYIAGSPYKTTTDASSAFSFAGLPRGIYKVIAEDKNRNTTGITSDTLNVDTHVNNNQSIQMSLHE